MPVAGTPNKPSVPVTGTPNKPSKHDKKQPQWTTKELIALLKYMQKDKKITRISKKDWPPQDWPSTTTRNAKAACLMSSKIIKVLKNNQNQEEIIIRYLNPDENKKNPVEEKEYNATIANLRKAVLAAQRAVSGEYRQNIQNVCNQIMTNTDNKKKQWTEKDTIISIRLAMRHIDNEKDCVKWRTVSQYDQKDKRDIKALGVKNYANRYDTIYGAFEKLFGESPLQAYKNWQSPLIKDKQRKEDWQSRCEDKEVGVETFLNKTVENPNNTNQQVARITLICEKVKEIYLKNKKNALRKKQKSN
jgi:hypothetical protein